MLWYKPLGQCGAHSRHSIHIHGMPQWVFKPPADGSLCNVGRTHPLPGTLLGSLWVCTTCTRQRKSSPWKPAPPPRLPPSAERASLLCIHFGPTSGSKFTGGNAETPTVRSEMPLRQKTNTSWASAFSWAGP